MLFSLMLCFAYVECGKSAINFWKEEVEPKVLKTSKWRPLVRGIIFVLNPLVWILTIIIGFLVLIAFALVEFINFLPNVYYGSITYFEDIIKDIKE